MQASRSRSKTADDCSICLTPMSVDSALLNTACNHLFHFDCLTKNMQVSLNNECPLCCAPLDSTRASYQLAQSQQQYHFEQRQNVSNVAIMLREEREIRIIMSISEISYNTECPIFRAILFILREPAFPIPKIHFFSILIFLCL
jgi:hypothetical protein